MLDDTNSTGRTCPRCGRTTTPRGAEPPRYCATCGYALLGPAGPGPGLPGAGGFPVIGLLALLLGLGGLLPMCGFPFAFLAVGVGWTGSRRAGCRGANQVLANVGTGLGLVTLLLWLLRWL